MKIKTFILFSFLPYFGYAKNYEVCPQSEKKCLMAAIKSNVTKKMDYWKKFSSKPFKDRVFVAPQELLEVVTLDNRLNKFPNRPKSPEVSKEFIQDIKDAINELPPSVKKVLEKKLVGVFLLSDLGGTALADSIKNEKGEEIAGFVTLDYDVLKKRTANQWATWKESTPFRKDSKIEIQAIIEEEKNNTRKYAIQYILLHEFGHIISIGETFHPPWIISPKDQVHLEKYDFFNLSWSVDKKLDSYISKFDDAQMPDRYKVIYYFGAKLRGIDMVKVYSDLEKTNFPTLYAATNPGDDFAESFVTYVHSVLMKKPFSIEIKNNGKTVKNFQLCWGKPRCKKKGALLKKFFGE